MTDVLSEHKGIELGIFITDFKVTGFFKRRLIVIDN